jgi:hypothetical protein
MEKGLGMDAPTSAISLKFLKYVERNHMLPVLARNKIVYYSSYADDTIIIYDQSFCNIEGTLIEFNKIHPKTQYASQLESNNILKFRGVTVTRNPTHLDFPTFRTPTSRLYHCKRLLSSRQPQPCCT